MSLVAGAGSMKWLIAIAIVSAFYALALTLLFGLKMSGTAAIILGGVLSIPGALIAMPFGGIHSGMAFLTGMVVNWFLYVSLVRYFIREK